MKNLIGALFMLFLLGACEQQQAIPATQQQLASAVVTQASSDYPAALPFELQNAKGERVSFPRQNGVVDVYFFWATWCPYCKQLMPHLQSIVDEYDGKVSIQAINMRENGQPETYLNNNGYSFELYPEGDLVASMYGIKGTPGVVIVDTEGQVRFDMSALLAPANKALEGLKHGQRAQRIAPWWAAEIRRALDQIVKS
ncbi:MAG: TlpA disulfide reductase family protein [Gammaproteobacteria bacterium]|nr:TlpA disulfide reductase family protein [Gammaproteobacteria bacterium]